MEFKVNIMWHSLLCPKSESSLLFFRHCRQWLYLKFRNLEKGAWEVIADLSNNITCFKREVKLSPTRTWDLKNTPPNLWLNSIFAKEIQLKPQQWET